jgi:hypothetical protein
MLHIQIQKTPFWHLWAFCFYGDFRSHKKKFCWKPFNEHCYVWLQLVHWLLRRILKCIGTSFSVVDIYPQSWFIIFSKIFYYPQSWFILLPVYPQTWLLVFPYISTIMIYPSQYYPQSWFIFLPIYPQSWFILPIYPQS